MSNIRNSKLNLTQFWENKHSAREFFLFLCNISVNPVNKYFIRYVTIPLKDLKYQMSSYVPFELIDSNARDKNLAFVVVYDSTKILLGQILGSKVLFSFLK